MLHLPESLWGPNRQSNDLMITSARELTQLRKKRIVADWSTTKRTTLFRLADTGYVPPEPSQHLMARGDGSPDKMKLFLSIISKGRKDNTYKFALGKTLLDYCKNNAPDGRTRRISYDYLAGEFLRHYWYQRYRFRMKQDFHTQKSPKVIQILEKTFGHTPPHKFQDLDQSRMRIARDVVTALDSRPSLPP